MYNNRRKRSNTRNNNRNEQGGYMYGAFEQLLKECRRLEARVRYLERELDRRPDDDEEVDLSWYDNDVKPQNAKQTEHPAVDFSAAHRRNTDDLYKEARDKHEKEETRKRYLKQQSEQEAIVDEVMEMSNRNVKPPEVVFSENKKQFYIEQGRAAQSREKNRGQ